MQNANFTPALGRAAFTGSYDLAVRLLTRERFWRGELLRQVSPRNGETIVDVGCGTGTFALMLKQVAPESRVIGLDPDPHVLELAARKSQARGLAIEWRQGFARDAAELAVSADKAVSSLVFHQVPLTGKREGIAAMFDSVRSGGEVHIADYARQHGVMRALFRLTVQVIDGVADTQPNADGVIEHILHDIAGLPSEPQVAIPTPTGTISLFMAQKP